jgi:hypothetical protein
MLAAEIDTLNAECEVTADPRLRKCLLSEIQDRLREMDELLTKYTLPQPPRS